MASDTPFSVRAAYRHLKHAYDRSPATAPGVTTDDAARFVASADQDAVDGASARVAGQRGEALEELESLRAEAKILAMVLTRLGVDPNEVLESMREGQELASAEAGVSSAGVISDELIDKAANDLEQRHMAHLADASSGIRRESQSSTRGAVGVRREGEAAQAALPPSMHAPSDMSNPKQINPTHSASRKENVMTTESRKSLIGVTIHFYGAKTVHVGDPLAGEVIVTMYGKELVVTERIIENSIDRNGDSWLDLLDDPAEQTRRWGSVLFARGPWPKGELRFAHGSVEWTEARHEALQIARAHPDPDIRAKQMLAVKQRYASNAPSALPKAGAKPQPLEWESDDE